MATTVANKKDGRVPNGVYIGRGSVYGNPFVIDRDGDRAEVIGKYKQWLVGQIVADRRPPTVAEIRALAGKALICYCKPLACHGDVLAYLADKYAARG